jgi:hypothetical protein
MPIFYPTEELFGAESSSTNRLVGSTVKYSWTSLKDFFVTQKPSASDPVLLIVDGHTSHTRNLHLTLLWYHEKSYVNSIININPI